MLMVFGPPFQLGYPVSAEDGETIGGGTRASRVDTQQRSDAARAWLWALEESGYHSDLAGGAECRLPCWLADQSGSQGQPVTNHSLVSLSRTASLGTSESQQTRPGQPQPCAGCQGQGIPLGTLGEPR